MRAREFAVLSIVVATGAAGAAGVARAAEPVRLTLAEALDRARASSARVGRFDAQAAAAQAAAGGARAERRPVAQLQAGYQRLSDVPELKGLLPGAGVTTIFPNIPDNWRSRAQVSMPLYAGGRLARLEEAAGLEAGAARLDRDAALADLGLETTTAFWSLVTAREDERVVGESLRSFDAHIREARNRAGVGLAAPNEVLAVQVERDQAELARLRAAADARVAEADLARLVGLPEGAAIEPVERLVADASAAAPAPLQELTAAAVARREELRALAERAEASAKRARAARAGLRPTVNALAGYDYASPNRRILPPEEEWRSSWDAVVSATWAVFDGGRTRAAVAEAEARAAAARSALEDASQLVRLEVTRRWHALRTTAEEVTVTEAGVVSARENRRVAEERYRAGVAPSTELLDAETALLRAELARTSALARLRVARAALARATGEGS